MHDACALDLENGRTTEKSLHIFCTNWPVQVCKIEVVLLAAFLRNMAHHPQPAVKRTIAPIAIATWMLLSSGQLTAAQNSSGETPSVVGPPAPSNVETKLSPLRPAIENSKSAYSNHALSITEAIEIASAHYPKVLKARVEVNASKESVRLQKINEYMPEALFQYQEIMASRNKVTQIIYGSPVFPGNPGPGLESVSMRPIFFSGGGFNFDWQPLDFGLHRARINLSKAGSNQASLEAAVTDFDAQVSAALNFLDAVMTKEQILAAEANLQSFEQIRTAVNSQVSAKLRPAADSYLARAEVASARSTLTRAKLAQRVALSNLANAIGIAGQEIDVSPGVLTSYIEHSSTRFPEPDFNRTPLMAAAQGQIAQQLAQKSVLSKQYFPTFHWLFGMQLRGSGLNTRARDQSKNVDGLFPVVPNYQLAMIVNWNFLDFARLHQEKRIQDLRIRESHLNLELIKNNLRTEDIQTKAQLEAAYEIVENAKVQLQAAEIALKQTRARYDNGLASITQLAEASQSMAQARLEETRANAGIWRTLLTMSALRGDLKPFLNLTVNAVRRP